MCWDGDRSWITYRLHFLQGKTDITGLLNWGNGYALVNWMKTFNCLVFIWYFQVVFFFFVDDLYFFYVLGKFMRVSSSQLIMMLLWLDIRLHFTKSGHKLLNQCFTEISNHFTCNSMLGSLRILFKLLWSFLSVAGKH